ncbi:MAG TPA: hypothetical protein VJV78_39195 [Polyangiales bacterium]|nr:hypothetical protein [Polyangiales bacterium]
MAGARAGGGPAAMSCMNPQQLCGADCVDVKTDRSNCGKCGQSCEPAGECRDGKCHNPKDDKGADKGKAAEDG